MVILVPVFNHIGFSGTIITVCQPEPGDIGFPVIGCTCRPTVRLEIPDVEEIMVADRPAWIPTHMSFLSGYMSLLPMQYIPPLIRIDDTLLFAFEQADQALACHHLRYFDTCQFKKGWCHVDHAGKVADNAARGLNPGSPTDGKRDPGPGVIVVGFTAGERHAMVTGDNDDGILKLADFLQGNDCIHHQCVKALHLVIVISHIAPYYRVIRETFEQSDFIEIHSAPCTRTFVIGPVRVAGSKPETKRFASIPIGQEIFESLLILFSCRMLIPPVQLARSPAFPVMSYLIASLFQQ